MGQWELDRSGAIQPSTLGYGNCNDVDNDDCFVDEQLDHHSIITRHGYEQKQSNLGDSDDGGACFMEE